MLFMCLIKKHWDKNSAESLMKESMRLLKHLDTFYNCTTDKCITALS